VGVSPAGGNHFLTLTSDFSMISNSFFSSCKRRGATLAGVFSLAFSCVLLCGAGSVPIENLLPQGAMQGDLNAGGHSLTNAATVSATNMVVSGTLTAPSSFTLPFSQLTSTPTTLAGYAITDAEPALGNPSTDGYVLSSTTGGVRSWIAPGVSALDSSLTAVGFSLTSGTLYLAGVNSSPGALVALDSSGFLDYPNSTTPLADSSGNLYNNLFNLLVDGSGNIYVSSQLIDSSSSPGTAGQVLTSTGSSVAWGTAGNLTVGGTPLSSFLSGTYGCAWEAASVTDLSGHAWNLSNASILTQNRIVHLIDQDGTIGLTDGSVSGLAAFQSNKSLARAVSDSTTPTNTTTPAGWIHTTVGGVSSWVPYYR